ncbi:MAG: linalool dehydratase/isomerase domain-containing protein [Planctomycetota bacterium]
MTEDEHASEAEATGPGSEGPAGRADRPPSGTGAALPFRVRLGLAAASLLVGAAIWFPAVHLFFGDDADELVGREGISPWAKALAERHLALWEEPGLRAEELRKMRASNAEWDFMGRSFLVWSLGNMALRDPALKGRCLAVMDTIIDDTLLVEHERGMFHFLMTYATERGFLASPERSLFIDGEIALMLAHRRIVEEKPAYAQEHRKRVRVMIAQMEQSRVLCAESYPDECWMFCNSIALAAIRMADHLDGTDHSAFIGKWLATAKAKLVHEDTGILVSSFTVDGYHMDGPEGSSIWLASHCLALVDEEFARDQYERARKELGRDLCGFAWAREWPPSCDAGADIDSGPTVPLLEANAGSSGLAFVGAAAFGDGDFLSGLHASVEFGGLPVRRGGRLKYCASNQVGDAVLLYAAVLGPVWEKVKAGRGEAR